VIAATYGRCGDGDGGGGCDKSSNNNRNHFTHFMFYTMYYHLNRNYLNELLARSILLSM
jgi:hypothetical protein